MLDRHLVLRTVKLTGLLAAVCVFGHRDGLGQVPAATPAAKPATAPATPPAQYYDGKYEVLPVLDILLQDTLDAKKARRNGEAKMAAIHRGSEPLQANIDAANLYYGQYFFSRLTYPQYLGEWAETRQKFLTQQLAMRSMPAEVHTYLVNQARSILTTIIRGNYHPVARCNAMLLLGALNADEAVLVGEEAQKRPPIPLTAALGVMFQSLDDAQQSDAVKAAALVGILRHVRTDGQSSPARRALSGQSPEQRNRENLIVGAMLKLVEATEAPEGRTQAGHDWLRRRAVEVLGYLGAAGQNNSVVNALDAVLVDDTAPILLRCAVAEALGRLNYPQNLALDVTDAAKKIGTVGAFACREEIARVEAQQAKEEEEKSSTAAGSPYGGYGSGYGSGYGGDEYGSGYPEEYGGGYPEEYGDDADDEYGSGYGSGGYGPAGMGGIMGSGSYGPATPEKKKPLGPLGYRIALTRRRVKHQLLQVKEGLVGPKTDTGMLALAKDQAQQDYVGKVIKGIDGIIEVVDSNEDTEMETLLEKLGGKVQLLENDCGIVVALPGTEAEGMLDDSLLLDIPDIPGAPTTPPGGTPATPPGDPLSTPPGDPLSTPPGGPPAAPPAGKPATPPTGPPAVPPGGAPAKPPAGTPALP